MAKKKVAQDGSGGKKSVEDGKVIAIVSYITWIGLIVAFVLNIDKKNDFAKFHIRQALLLMIIALVGSFIFWIPILGWALAIILFILWLIGLIAAINGQKKLIPIIGKWAQDLFKGL